MCVCLSVCLQTWIFNCESSSSTIYQINVLVGGLVGLDIFGHQEGKEHELTRILFQPQLVSKFKPKKMQVWRYYIFSNWHWTPWSISLIQSTRERKFFCNFKLFRPLWQLLHSLRTNLRRKLGECTIILYQLSPKTGLVWITVNVDYKKLCKKMFTW